MSTRVGQQAEAAAAIYLERKGFRIVDRNWRTRWCEIDIIATRQTAIYFVEVKYRANNQHGWGLDYITPKKQQQMHFAAEFWLAGQNDAFQAHLSALEVSGPGFAITQWLPDL